MSDLSAEQLVFDRLPFERLAREISQDYKTDMYWQDEHALTALQLCVEAHLKGLLRGSQALVRLQERCSISSASSSTSSTSSVDGDAGGFGSLVRELHQLDMEMEERKSESESDWDSQAAGMNLGEEGAVAAKEITLARRLSHMHS